jgi:hypothetical protein
MCVEDQLQEWSSANWMWPFVCNKLRTVQSAEHWQNVKGTAILQNMFEWKQIKSWNIAPSLPV